MNWIPIKTQLPKSKGQYLVTYHLCLWGKTRDKTYIGIDSYRGGNGGHWAQEKNHKVIAWMPLPEPPKEETDELD